MIDFIRIKYEDKSKIETFVCDEKNFQELKASIEYHSGEVKYPYKAKLENIDIVVNDKHVYVKNSLHKFYNVLNGNGNHNFNDFSFDSLCDVIDYLTKKLPELEDATITQLEFGLNINTDIPAESIIKHNVIMHLLKEHNHNKRFQGKGEYKQFDHADYYIKIYDKAKQFKRDENILRFEIKFIRKREFNKLGIYKINDLKSKDNLERVFDYLLKRFDELLIVDLLDDKIIPPEVMNQLRTYLSPHFWLNLSDRKKRNLKSKHKKNLYRILNDYNLLTKKHHLSSLLSSKFSFLINY